MESKNFSFSLEKGIGRLVFDLDGEKVNKLTSEVMKEFGSVIDQVKSKNGLNVLIFESAKKDIFIAGADIQEIKDITEPKDGFLKAKMGQDIINKIEGLPFPTIAAIDGAALGGGCEFALAFTYRVMSDNAKSQIGLPEVSLGIIPGFGGTQRLPRLIGASKALPIILTAKAVNPKKAEKIGLVDAVFSEAFFKEKTIAFAKRLLVGEGPAIQEKRKKKRSVLLDNNPLGRWLVYKKSKESILKATKGQMPAPLQALKAVRSGLMKPLKKGLEIEANLFSEIVGTDICKTLIQLYYTNEEIKKYSGVKDKTLKTPIHFQQAGVLGAGLMGGGIAWLFSYRGATVRIKDIAWDALAKSFETAEKIYKQLVKKRRIKKNLLSVYMNKLSGTLEPSGFYHTDIVVEAVVENTDIKHAVYKELEPRIKPTTILATNTSALDITELGSVLKRKDRFIGMHFFSPVNRMPLVEVIPGKHTSDETIMQTVACVKQLKKTPIVVANCPGFLVNRILIPYVSEAIKLVAEGVDIQLIDKIARDFGLPLGPLELADEVGLDVGYKVAKILEDGYGERMKIDDFFHNLAKDKSLLGKKSGKGFYNHDSKNKQKIVNADLVQGRPSVTIEKDVIQDRLILIMVNEAARCLEEDVVANERFLDLAMLMGTGFPVFRGGLCRYADSRGLRDVESRLVKLSSTYGERFNPAPLIGELAQKNIGFYSR